MTEIAFNNYFTWMSCPLCGGSVSKVFYPIDKKYLVGHTGVNVSGHEIGVAICPTCMHQFIQPLPTPKFLELFYSSYMSAAKNGFYRIRKSKYIPAVFENYYAPWLEKINKHSNNSELKFLDIGCGLGMFLRLARAKGFEVRGIEPNSEAVEYLAREHSIKAYNTLLEEYSGEEKFDTVTMWDLLEHLAKPKTALEKVRSILNPDGLLVLEIPIRDSLLHWTAKALYRLSFGIIRRPLFLTYGVHHLQYFSEKSIVSFLELNGFTLLERKRAETSLEALKKKQDGLKSSLYNISLYLMFSLAKLIGKKNKLVLIARKLPRT